MSGATEGPRVELVPLTELPALLDAAQCAALLRCSREHVEELADRGALPATKFGRGWVFPSQQLLEKVASICESERTARADRTTDAPPAQSRRTLFVPPGSPPRRRGRPRLPTPQLG